MGTEALWIPAVIAAVSGGVQAYNGIRTDKKRDAQLASSIRRQGQKQQAADKRVGEEVNALEQSTAREERNQRLAQYMDTLRTGKQVQGLAPTIGSSAFREDAADAASGVQQYAAGQADLGSRIDAPGMQRQGEAFGFGKLATDIDMLKRESRGDAFIDELRLRGIRRNPWLDALASVGQGVAMGMAGGAGGGGSLTNKGASGLYKNPVGG